MSKPLFSPSLFARAPLVGIIRNLPVDAVIAMLPVYRESGLTTIEITMNTPDAEAMIRLALDDHADGLNVGAGTVCTTRDLDKAIAAGAQFIVTPIMDERVIRACVGQGIPIFPGAYTPSEIYRAWELGAFMVKVFPALGLGPAFVKDLKGPLPQINLLPTGGVGLANMAHFFKAGATGVGVGGQLFDPALLATKDRAGLKAHFGEFVSQLPTHLSAS